MSRRTKLCITALFLVLLAIPVAYVGVTWHVGEPLRFRLLSYKFIPGDSSTLPHCLMRVEVENTSPTTPVLLERALLLHKDGSGYFMSPAQDSRKLLEGLVSYGGPGSMQEEVIIRSGHRWQCTGILVSHPRIGASLPKDIVVSYHCASVTRYRVLVWYYSLLTYLPASWQPQTVGDFSIQTSLERPEPSPDSSP